MVGNTSYTGIKTFGSLCFLLIPMYYRFIAILRLHAERKKQGFPKLPPSAYPFCDFLTYHEKIIDLAIYAAVWVFTALLIAWHYPWSAMPVYLVFLCLIPVGQSLVRAIRERNPDRFSLEALLLFLLLLMDGFRWELVDLMRNFPILFTVPLYHWLCRRFMKRFAVSAEGETGEEN